MKKQKSVVSSLLIILVIMAAFCVPVVADDATGNAVKININTASVEELAALQKIGPKIAERIVQYREDNGGFTEIEDIIKVKGVGEKTFELIKDSITVDAE